MRLSRLAPPPHEAQPCEADAEESEGAGFGDFIAGRLCKGFEANQIVVRVSGIWRVSGAENNLAVRREVIRICLAGKITNLLDAVDEQICGGGDGIENYFE